MINLSRRAALGVTLVMALVVALVFGLTVNALAIRNSPTPHPVAAEPTVAVSSTPEPAADTPTNTLEPAADTPTITPESPTITPEPPTEIPSVTLVPEPPTATPTVVTTPGNLLGNESFEQSINEGETRWSFNPVASTAESAWSANAARTGARSLSITTTAFRPGGWPGWSTAAFIPIERGKTYTFSAWARSVDGSYAWLSVDMYDANGKFRVGYSTGCLPLNDQGEWQQLTRTIPSTAGATQVKLDMLQCGQSPSGSTVFYDDAFFGVTAP